MWDVAYLVVTVLFFAAMLWYVQGCEHLGGKASPDDAEEKRGGSSRRRTNGGN